MGGHERSWEVMGGGERLRTLEDDIELLEVEHRDGHGLAHVSELGRFTRARADEQPQAPYMETRVVAVEVRAGAPVEYGDAHRGAGVRGEAQVGRERHL